MRFVLIGGWLLLASLARADQLCIQIPDAQASTVYDAIASAYGYPDTITTTVDATPAPNPQTKKQFAKQRLRDYLVGLVKAHTGDAAATSARQSALQNFDDSGIQ